MSKIETYVQNAINIANDNTHGYSQINRWGKDYDCSSLVITVVENAGIPVKSKKAVQPIRVICYQRLSGADLQT